MKSLQRHPYFFLLKRKTSSKSDVSFHGEDLGKGGGEEKKNAPPFISVFPNVSYCLLGGVSQWLELILITGEAYPD